MSPKVLLHQRKDSFENRFLRYPRLQPPGRRSYRPHIVDTDKLTAIIHVGAALRELHGNSSDANLRRDSNISWSTVSKAVDRSCYQSREGPADGRYQCCDICGLINFVKTVKYQVLQQLRSYYPLRCFRDKVNMRLDTGLKLGSTSESNNGFCWSINAYRNKIVNIEKREQLVRVTLFEVLKPILTGNNKSF